MPGAFGLAECLRDDRVDTTALVELHPTLDVFQLYRSGVLTPGAEAQIQGGGALRALPGGGKIEIDNQLVSIAWHPALPLRVFICPRCEGDCYKLHRVAGAWRCRRCHKLDYQSRHRHRTIPGFNRLVSLRRRIGADLTPFSPLPAKPLAARRHWRLVREIRQLETRLLEHARRDVAEVLERRHANRS